jgi:hypothetical protein
MHRIVSEILLLAAHIVPRILSDIAPAEGWTVSARVFQCFTWQIDRLPARACALRTSCM